MTANNGALPLMNAPMPLPRGLLQKLKSLVIANGINGELQAAFNYVGQLGHIQPTGNVEMPAAFVLPGYLVTKICLVRQFARLHNMILNS